MSKTTNKKKYVQKYSKAWEADSDLKGKVILLYFCHLQKGLGCSQLVE